ncbi:MAG TPA: tetratricopeptide repeat protein [Abditibacteriaceae bacterium]
MSDQTTLHEQQQNDIFLGRAEEQDRFRDALRAVKAETTTTERIKGAFLDKEQAENPFIFLLHGEGGMGKSTLARRLRDIAQGEDDFKNHFRVLWLDWETQKHLDERLVARDAVSPETVFEHIYTLFSKNDFGNHFDAYEKAKKKRSEVESKVAQAVSREAEKGSRGATLVKLGAKGITKLIQLGGGSGYPMPVPTEATEQALETVIEGGAAVMAQVREEATTWLRSTLDPEEYDIQILPHQTLARHLAEGIRAVANQKLLLLVLDTYEIADRADFWLREVMRRAGARVIWVLAGRDDLAPTRRFGDDYFPGYDSDDLLAKRLRNFNMREFSEGNVTEYFATRVESRPLPDGGAAAIHRATMGIPLAVGEAAAIWEKGVALEEIVGNVPSHVPRDEIVRTMTERFLKHCYGDKANPQDLTRLHALASARRPNPRLLAAMLQTTNLQGDLVGLKRRHSFVFVDDMKLHNAVAAFLREYLLQDLHRQDPELRALHQRAVTQAREACIAREGSRPTLEERLEDELWQEATLDLAHHSFWLEEDDGWAVLLPAFVGALAYDRDFARALLQVAEPLAETFTNKGRRQLKLLTHAIDFRRLEQAGEALNALEKASRHWPDDGCHKERRAILTLRRARLLHNQNKHHESLKLCDEVENKIPKEGEILRRQLGRLLNDLGNGFQWPEGSLDAVRSPEAEQILSRAITLLPEDEGNWYSLGTAQSLSGKKEDAIVSLQKAIDLDSKDAYAHYGLGNVHRDLGQQEKAATAYKKAIELDPEEANYLSGYAVFLCVNLRDFTQARSYFQQAVEAAPNNPQYAINYAALSLSQWQLVEGRTMLLRAEAMPDLTEPQKVGIAFHHYIHFPDGEPSPLKHLKALLAQGMHAEDWTFALNLERARQDGHPNVALLEALAAVISGESDLATLDAFPEWQAA